MPDPTSIYNWRRLDDRITTSGQPTESQLVEIKALGVRHIINLGLHSHEKALSDERASVIELGMSYTNIPVDFQAPTVPDFRLFCAELAAHGDVPLHVHCIANYRVAAFLHIYRRDVLGEDEAKTRAAMEAIWHPNEVWERFIAAAGQS